MWHQPAVLLFLAAIPVFAQVTPVAPYYADNSARIHDYVFRTYTDPTRFAWLLVDSATDHWFRVPHGWDQSAESYTFRVASGWGRRIVRNTAMLGMETALHEDSRYRRLGERRFTARFLFAVSHSVLAYKPDGSVEPMYGRMAAGVLGAAVSSTWHPQSISAVTLLSGVGQGAIDRASNNLLTEFEPELRSFGRRTWNAFLRK